MSFYFYHWLYNIAIRIEIPTIYQDTHLIMQQFKDLFTIKKILCAIFNNLTEAFAV